MTISDKKLAVDSDGNGVVDYYNADVVTANDYYPFGSQMPGRKFSQPNSSYRYGYNGKENDKDISEGGQDYGMRIYDSRLGRFLSVDPLTRGFPMLTPYQFASNTPIAAIDVEGLEAEIVIDRMSKQVNVLIKLSVTDADLNVLKAAGMSTDNIQSKFKQVFAPGKDGNTANTSNALNISKKTKSELEGTLGGQIASGGDGYFNLDMGSEGSYKVFFSLQIDKSFDASKDPSVVKLNAKVDPSKGEDGTELQNINTYFKPGTYTDQGIESKAQQIVHEIGHSMGLIDYYRVTEDRPFNTPGLQITYKNQIGGTSVATIKELMEQAGGIKILSVTSLRTIVVPSIQLANKQKPNKAVVTTVTGEGNQHRDSSTKSGAKSTHAQPKLVKKK